MSAIYNVPTILENIRSRAGRDRMISWQTAYAFSDYHN